MAVLPGCTITDTYAVLSPSGVMVGHGGRITARASVTPLFVQQSGGVWIEHANTVVGVTEAGGSWTLVLPSQPNCDPATVTWTITLPDGTVWTGAVTAAMVTASQSAPLSVHALKATYGWTATPVALTTPLLGVAGGIATLDANSHVQQQAVYDSAEAATNDTLGATSTLLNTLNRIRYQLAQLGTGTWNSLRAMVQLSPAGQQSGTINVSGEIVGRDFKPGGLTGATAPSRLAGGTAAGAPTSGTFAQGDLIVDQSGSAWVCTTAGTPGTWAATGARGAPATYWVWIDPGSGQVKATNTRTGAADATGATTDVVLSSLVATLGSTLATVSLSPQTHTLSAPLTLPATLSVVLPAGAVLSHGASALTINGPLSAGPYQVFSGSGTVLLGRGSVTHVYAEWWGARNGSASDAAAVQAAANAVSGVANGYGVVRLLPATYSFTASVECPPNVAFIGTGKDGGSGTAGTVIALASGVDGFTWTGASSNGKTVIGNLSITGGRHGINAANTTTYVTYVHLFDLYTQPATGAGIHLQGNIEEWYVERWNHRGGACGVQMEDIGTPGSVSYVDKSHFVDCQIDGATNCIKWFCKQGNHVTFEHCTFNTAQQHAVWLDCGVNTLRFVACNTEVNGQSGKSGNTTGSITSATSTLSVASAAGFTVGDTIVVRGAAAHGLDLSTTISAIAGTTFTLGASAGATVSGVRVTNAQYDEIYVTATVAGIGNVALVGGGWGSNYTNQIRYWINNGAAARFEISADVLSSVEAYDPQTACIALASRAPIVRPSDQFLDWGRGLFAPTVASGNAGERASYPSTPGGDWEAVLRTSGQSGNGSAGTRGWLFRKADSNNAVVAQLFPDGSLTPTRIANRTSSMTGATPDVSGADAYITANASPTTVTAFTGGRQGQQIRIIFGDSQTTIQNNAAIVTGSGANIVATGGKTASFLLMNSVWYRMGGTA